MKALIAIVAFALCGCTQPPAELIVVTDDARPTVAPRPPIEAPKPTRFEPFPDPAFVAPVIVEPAQPVVELYALTAKSCVPCRQVHAIAGGLTGITFIDIDELPDEVIRINGEQPPSVPCFVRMVDGVRVDRWIGLTNRQGLINMRDGK